MINLGLRRIAELNRRLGNPLANLKVFHVSGTNGKGSVCTYLEAALSSRFKVGKFTSPHLISPNDSIQIRQKSLPLQEYLDLSQEVEGVSEKYGIGASEFEIQTAVAFSAFKRHGIETAIVEVGLGGLEDATNILQPSNVLCSAITKVGIDHEAFLGSTLPSVARHKAGIIKPGVPCVVDGTNSPEVLEVVSQKAQSVNAPLIQTPSHTANFVEANKLLAKYALHQVCPDLGSDVVDSEINAAIWPGRLQWINMNTLVDGAHNRDSARELRRYADETVGVPIRWVVAFSKPADPILKILVRPQDELVATEFEAVEGMPWVVSQRATDVAYLARNYTAKVSVELDISNLPEFEGVTIICGSLYLVGNYLKKLKEH